MKIQLTMIVRNMPGHGVSGVKSRNSVIVGEYVSYVGGFESLGSVRVVSYAFTDPPADSDPAEKVEQDSKWVYLGRRRTLHGRSRSGGPDVQPSVPRERSCG